MVVNYILLNVLRKKRKPTVRPPEQKSLQGLIRQPSVQIFITKTPPAMLTHLESGTEEDYQDEIVGAPWM